MAFEFSGFGSWWRLVWITALTQSRLLFRNLQEWARVFMMPLHALFAMAVLVHAGRPDLAGYALTAALLFTIDDMGFFVGSEIVAGDRSWQVLELMIAAPASYFVGLITRTLQNAVNGPFYLLGGVLVPATFLPAWLQVFSPFVFFFWSANLVRDAFSPAEPADVVFRIGILITLGAFGGLIGALVLQRMRWPASR